MTKKSRTFSSGDSVLANVGKRGAAGGESVVASVTSPEESADGTYQVRYDDAHGETMEAEVHADDLEALGVGKRYRAKFSKPADRPVQFAVFIDDQRHTCIRVHETAKRVSYIPLESTGLRVAMQDTQVFHQQYLPLDGYGLGVAAYHFLRAAERYGCSAAAHALLQYLYSTVTKTEEDLIMKKAKAENPSITSAELKQLLAKGLPKDTAEKMDKVAKGAMAVVAKHNPGSASAKALAATDTDTKKKRGGKKAATAKAKPETQPKETTMNQKAKKTTKKTAKTTKSVKAAKTAAPKPAKAATKPSGESRLNTEAKIIIVAKENPRREGTAAHAKFEVLKKSKTVGDALRLGAKHGLDAGCLRFNEKKGYIKIK